VKVGRLRAANHDEADHALHLMVADPKRRHKTMIAGTVDPGLLGSDCLSGAA
jgi:hypothetical protein